MIYNIYISYIRYNIPNTQTNNLVDTDLTQLDTEGSTPQTYRHNDL